MCHKKRERGAPAGGERERESARQINRYLARTAPLICLRLCLSLARSIRPFLQYSHPVSKGRQSSCSAVDTQLLSFIIITHSYVTFYIPNFHHHYLLSFIIFIFIVITSFLLFSSNSDFKWPILRLLLEFIVYGFSERNGLLQHSCGILYSPFKCVFKIVIQSVECLLPHSMPSWLLFGIKSRMGKF